MNKQLKELIDCMKKGWNILPHCTNGLTIMQDGAHEIGYNRPILACCPIVHAVIGKEGHNLTARDAMKTFFRCDALFPILKNQIVGGFKLGGAIIVLADNCGWTTPDIINWLTTHLDD